MLFYLSLATSLHVHFHVHKLTKPYYWVSNGWYITRNPQIVSALNFGYFPIFSAQCHRKHTIGGEYFVGRYINVERNNTGGNYPGGVGAVAVAVMVNIE